MLEIKGIINYITKYSQYPQPSRQKCEQERTRVEVFKLWKRVSLSTISTKISERQVPIQKKDGLYNHFLSE